MSFVEVEEDGGIETPGQPTVLHSLDIPRTYLTCIQAINGICGVRRAVECSDDLGVLSLS